MPFACLRSAATNKISISAQITSVQLFFATLHSQVPAQTKAEFEQLHCKLIVNIFTYHVTN